jgi:hypothetical protein
VRGPAWFADRPERLSKTGDFFGARPKKVRSTSGDGSRSPVCRSPRSPLSLRPATFHRSGRTGSVAPGRGAARPLPLAKSRRSGPEIRTSRAAHTTAKTRREKSSSRNSGLRNMLQKTGKLGFSSKQISARIRLCVEHGLRRAWNACRELDNPPQPGFEAPNPFPLVTALRKALLRASRGPRAHRAHGGEPNRHRGSRGEGI